MSVAGATNQPDIQTQTPVLTSVRARAHDETVYKTFFTNVKSAYYNDFWRIMDTEDWSNIYSFTILLF